MFEKKSKYFFIIFPLFLIYFFSIVVFFIFTRFIIVDIKNIVITMLISFFMFFILLVFFIVRIDWFKDINTGKEINYLNISNFLSSLRFIFVPTLIYMFNITMSGQAVFKTYNVFTVKIVLFVFGGLICLTDLFDGYFARKFNEITKIGQIIDPLGDFIMIFSFTILVFNHKLMTWWFFLITLIRIPLLLFLFILFPIFKVKFRILSSFLGKATIFYLMSFLALCIYGLLFNNDNSKIYDYYLKMLLFFQIVGAFLMVFSFIEKGFMFYKLLKDRKSDL